MSGTIPQMTQHNIREDVNFPLSLFTHLRVLHFPSIFSEFNVIINEPKVFKTVTKIQTFHYLRLLQYPKSTTCAAHGQVNGEKVRGDRNLPL